MKLRLSGVRKITIVCLAFITLSCTNSNQDNKKGIEVLTLKGPSAMSMLFMMNELTEINDIHLEYKILDEPLQIRAAMLKNDPEFALIPTNLAANLYNKGIPYQLAAIPVWGTLYVLGKDKQVVKWEDLRGRRIHLMAKGMTPDVLFRFLAVRNGMDPDKDMTLDYSFPNHSDLANAMIAGLANIAILSEPLVSMVKSKNNDVEEVFNLDQEWKKVFGENSSIPQTSLVVRSDFAIENPDLVKSFIKKYEGYCSLVEKNIEDAGQLSVDFKILPEASIAIEAIPGCNMHVKPSWLVEDIVNSFLQVFYNFNPESIGGQMPDENFYFKK